MAIGAGAISCSLWAGTEDLSGQGRAAAAGQRLLGSSAPHLALKTIDGESIDLGKLYGKKAVYLKFWATWCTPCREQMPHFERTYQTAGADLAVIAVNIGFNDSLEDVREFKQRVGLSMPIVIDDGRLRKAFNLRVTPQHVVIGRDGRVQYVGHLADQRLESALVAARATASVVAQPSASSAAVSTRQYRVGDRLPPLTLAIPGGRTFQVGHSSSKATDRAPVYGYLM